MVNDEYVNEGLQYHQQGQLQQAIVLYEKALSIDAENHNAYYLLGMVAYQSQRFHQALKYIQKAMSIKVFPHYVFNLANIYYELKQFKLAMANYQLVIKVAPDFFDAYINLGRLFKESGKTNEAIQCYQTVLHLQPHHSLAYHNLALIAQEQGQLNEALKYFNQALEMDPNQALVRLHLGDLYHQMGQFKQAELYYQEVVKREPSPSMYLKLGKNYYSQNEISKAVQVALQAIQLDPNYHQGYYFLAEVLQEDKPSSLAEALEICLEHVDNKLHIQMMLSFYDVKNHQRAKALERLNKILAADDSYSGAYYQLAHLVMDLGQMKQAYHYFHKMLTLPSPYTTSGLEHERMSVHSNLLFSLRAMPQKNQNLYFETIQTWARDYMEKYYPTETVRTSNPDSEKTLKIGYVSGDFRTHSAAAVFELLFEHHNKKNVEIYAYSDLKEEDSKTQHFKELVNAWRPIHQVSDEQVVLMIENDGIDILVDLAGHTDNNRLGVFARKVVPLQVTGLGFGCTTGLKTIDYQWSDPYLVLPQETQLNSEKIFYLKNLVCWLPPRWTLTLSQSPHLSNGYITFGCGNSLAKINQDVIRCWAEILKQVPNAQLHIKTMQFEDEYAREYIYQAFQTLGIAPERLKLIGRSSQREHLEFYQTLDIALDPFPWSGGISTLEALWMGAPVITLNEGLRTSSSLLFNLGYSQFVSNSQREYIDCAVQLSNQIESLQTFRDSIRSRLWESSICNGRRFAREIEDSYRMMWRKWCRD